MIRIDKQLKENGYMAYYSFPVRYKALLKCHYIVNHAIKTYQHRKGMIDWHATPTFLTASMSEKIDLVGPP